MHRHKTVAQILLILSIFNSALAAPVLLQKRPNEPQTFTPVWPDARPSNDFTSISQPQLPSGLQHSPSMTGPGHLDYIPTSSGRLELLPPTVNTGHSEIQPYTSAAASPQHGEIQPYTSPPMSPQHGEIQPYTSLPASPAHSGPQSMTTPPQPVNKAPSKAAWRQKIMTPEKIKATKYIAGAAFLTTLYLGLLIPEITRNDNGNKGGQS